MRIPRFTQRFVISAKDGNYTDGSGLWLDVRKGGKAKSWSFRHSGKRISPPGGSAHKISVEQAQAFVRQCRDQLARDEDPFSARVQTKQAESKAKITFGECVEKWYAHKCLHDWHNDETKEQARGFIDNFIVSAGFANLPLQDITMDHMETILDPIWMSKPRMGKKVGYFLFGMFRWAKSKRVTPDSKLRWYVGENPADMTKYGELRQNLGRQPSGKHREALAVDDVPRLIAYLRTPRYAFKTADFPRDPNYCTVNEALRVSDFKVRESLNKALRTGIIRGAYKPLGHGYKQSPWLIPITALKKFTRLRGEIVSDAEIPLYFYILQFIIFTAVRSDMACHLRWEAVKRERGMIEYGSRHKTGNTGRLYNTIITDGVAEILDAMAARRERDQLQSEYVFVHGLNHSGINAFLDQPTNTNTVNSHLERALKTIGNIENMKATVHGFRTTFPTWACDIRSYPYEMVKATLGQAVGQQQVDASYFRNVKYLDQRREMMTKWEQYCLSLSSKPQQKKVVRLSDKPQQEKVVPLVRKRRSSSA